MRRPWQIWTVYIASLALVVAGVVWLSVRALESERVETAARQQAALEENTRLALWRMDSAKAPLVSDESARPYFAYMTLYPAERAYGRMFNDKAPASSAMLLSPLALTPNPDVLIHFQFDAQGGLTSPQVPTGSARNETVPRFISEPAVAAASRNLDRIRSLVKPAMLLAQLPPVEAAPTELQFSAAPPGTLGNEASADAAAPQSPPFNASRGTRRNLPQSPAQQQGYYGIPNAGYGSSQVAESAGQQAANAQPDDQQSATVQQRVRGDNEFQARSQYLTNSVNSSASRSGNFNGEFVPLVPGGASGEPASDARLSRMVPQWIAGELVLARRVNVNGREFVQGCLLDWPRIRRTLLAEISDLLPNADLVPLTSPAQEGLSRLLASLPVQLLPGEMPSADGSGLSPTQQSLLLAWAAMAAGALAVAVLLQGVIALSERRAAFVSAVTHELRTPLTTFRMYAEMLSEGMVNDEADRRRYLETLRMEADRLTHLVENVLAYARLERGGPGGRIGSIQVAVLLHHGERLAERARQAGLELLINADETTQASCALADASAVEQILFNLVDNACKYAVSAGDRSLHLEADADERHVRLRVRDHGRGIASQDRARLFQPFRKSADEAARSAPGVGLGLALSRRLARQIGGELSYETNGEPGASFVLLLRRAPEGMKTE